MRTIKTTLAAVLMICALAASQFDAQAQARRSTTTSASRSTASRSTASKSTASKSTASKPVSASRSSSTNKTASVSRSASSNSTTVNKSTASKTTSVSRSTSTKKTTTSQSAPAVRTASQNRTVKKQTETTTAPVRQTAKPSTTVAPNRPTSTPSPERDKVTRPVPQQQTKPAPQPETKPAQKLNTPPTPSVVHKPQPKPAPPKVHPRDRDFMHYSAPSRFWTSHNHCYGHRVKVIPSYAHRYVYHGVTYYCYDDIWYRPYSGYYVVCRPPFGTVLAANLIADMTWTAVKLSYYNTVMNTYSQINENNEYIAQQNAVIAQNNATIAAQNAQIASSQLMAQQAYTVANNLGLVQSYADASTNYYYQDGVFYVADSNGQYKVILPPAGAIVETIPEDHDMVTLADGKEYYKVDDTVYRITIIDGKPLFEVLGQMYF